MASQHIVMLPLMAQGHIIPFLSLAKLIELKNPGFTITLVSTPLNVHNLRPSLPPDSNIHLAAIPFRSSGHGLPPDSENTDSLSRHHILRLLQASETLEPHFERLVSDITRQDGRPPLCIVSDVFLGWTATVAKRLGIFHTTFTTCGAYGTTAYMSLWLNLPHARTDDAEFHVPGFPETFRLHRSQLSPYMRAADDTDPWSVYLRRNILLSLESDALLCNTVEEVEPAGLQLLARFIESVGLRLLAGFTGLRIWTIGPLLPLEARTSYRRAGKKPGMELEACVEWLDSHPPASVLYVSFGSQNTISASQMTELAAGLEASGKPFIWVIRPPTGFDLNEAFRDEWLPEGFEVRTRETRQGLLVRKWAPQLEILSHVSTGAFLSHCGWNSVMESLSRGVPIIGWPLASEQFYNSKILEEEMGAGVELARGVEDGIRHGEVERVIRFVMGDGKGKKMKEKAMEYAGMIRAAMRDDGDEKGSSIRALHGFIETAVSESTKTTSNGV